MLYDGGRVVQERYINHMVELKDEKCQVFYDKLKFIYLELPKFKKTIDQLESHFDKWLFLLRHLPHLDDPPQALQDDAFRQLFKVAEIANFSLEEQDAYEDSLKYYRNLNNVVDTSRQEGFEEGREEGREEERMLSLRRQRSLLLRQLSRKLGDLPDALQAQINQLPTASLESLSEALLAFETVADLRTWLS